MLRTYQKKLVQDVQAEYKKGFKRVMMVSPTGSGKTYTFSHMAKASADKGKRVLALTHKESILDQISESFESFGIDHGIIKAGRQQDLSLNVQVCSVQTLAIRLAKGKMDIDADFVIMDEAHHAAAGQWTFLADYFKDSYLLGATATPCRLDGRGLGDLFESLVMGPTVLELIEEKKLVLPRVYRPDTPIDLTQISTSMGDFNRGEMATVINRPKITGDTIAQYKKRGRNLPAVVFCCSIAHAEQVAFEFNQASIAADYIAGSMSSAVIKSKLRALASGSIKVLCSCDLISEGTDIPAVGCAILLRPTHSLSLYLQQVGRVLRPFEGKDESIILDQVDNILRHGHPAQDREWSLQQTKKKVRKGQTESEDINVKDCPECLATFMMPADCCPHCGHELEKKERLLSHVNGELKEVTLEDMEKAQQEARAKAKRRAVGMASSLDELWAIADERGYKIGWILYQYKLKVQKDFKKCLGDEQQLSDFCKRHDLMRWQATEAALDRALTVKYNNFISLKKSQR